MPNSASSTRRYFLPLAEAVRWVAEYLAANGESRDPQSLLFEMLRAGELPAKGNKLLDNSKGVNGGAKSVQKAE
jgi:hypothetical protein